MRIAFVMPAYNEELLLGETVAAVAPHVDRLMIVDDGSSDGTPGIADQLAAADPGRVTALHHPKNRGQGAAVVSGIRHLLDEADVDAIGIIAADNQCHTALIPAFRGILEVDSEIDVAKGSRFLHPATIDRMPRFRCWGNRGVSAVMQLVVGYHGMSDVLHGYLLARRAVFESMRLDNIADGYDLENTMMAEFRRLRARFALVPSPSRYGRETSKIVLRKQIPATLARMGQLIGRRLVDGTWRDRSVQLALLAALPTVGGTLPLAWAAMRATSPEVWEFPAPEGI